MVYSRNFPEADIRFVHIKDQGILTLTWHPSIKKACVMEQTGRTQGCDAMETYVHVNQLLGLNDNHTGERFTVCLFVHHYATVERIVFCIT